MMEHQQAETYQEVLDEAREKIIALYGYVRQLVSNFVERVKSFAQLINVKYEADMKIVKSLRASWIVKQDTRKLSQVLCNKPRVNLPRILY
jgi:hypothetical protein